MESQIAVEGYVSLIVERSTSTGAGDIAETVNVAGIRKEWIVGSLLVVYPAECCL